MLQVPFREMAYFNNLLVRRRWEGKILAPRTQITSSSGTPGSTNDLTVGNVDIRSVTLSLHSGVPMWKVDTSGGKMVVEHKYNYIVEREIKDSNRG